MKVVKTLVPVRDIIGAKEWKCIEEGLGMIQGLLDVK